MRKILNILNLLILVLLISCSGVNFKQWHFPYYMQVSQGTYLTTDKVNQIHIGMTKNEVNIILDKPVNQFFIQLQSLGFYIPKLYK